MHIPYFGCLKNEVWAILSHWLMMIPLKWLQNILASVTKQFEELFLNVCLQFYSLSTSLFTSQTYMFFFVFLFVVVTDIISHVSLFHPPPCAESIHEVMIVSLTPIIEKKTMGGELDSNFS